jgi:tRNA threonylcarbamoyladenosine biosynthesis protein TsaB
MLLFINATNLNEVIFALIDKAFFAETKINIPYHEANTTLPLLEKFLKLHKIKTTDLKKIIVASGPGSFTGIRVGIALAQGLSMSLNIPAVAITNNKIPKELMKLLTLKTGKKLNIEYGRSAF